MTNLRQLVFDTIGLLPPLWRDKVHAAIRLVAPPRRDVLGARHLKGTGIEIGAMHNPLRLPRSVTVRYVDYLSREDNLSRFPEIRHLKLVQPDHVEDGFTLPSFGPDATDFVVANHVLEHANNAVATLARWAEVLRAGGALFISVPLAERCFDKGRPITPLTHFVSDYDLINAGQSEAFRQATLSHYEEWLAISLPAIRAQGTPPAGPMEQEKTARTARQWLEAGEEIHFHTFTPESFEELLQYFCTKIRPDFRVAEIAENGIEVIGILQRAR